MELLRQSEACKKIVIEIPLGRPRLKSSYFETDEIVCANRISSCRQQILHNNYFADKSKAIKMNKYIREKKSFFQNTRK